jgi:hypothetical protein
MQSAKCKSEEKKLSNDLSRFWMVRSSRTMTKNKKVGRAHPTGKEDANIERLMLNAGWDYTEADGHE